MKSITKTGLIEKILNHFGYYKKVEKKTRKPRTQRVQALADELGKAGLSVGPLT